MSVTNHDPRPLVCFKDMDENKIGIFILSTTLTTSIVYRSYFFFNLIWQSTPSLIYSPKPVLKFTAKLYPVHFVLRRNVNKECHECHWKCLLVLRNFQYETLEMKHESHETSLAHGLACKEIEKTMAETWESVRLGLNTYILQSEASWIYNITT